MSRLLLSLRSRLMMLGLPLLVASGISSSRADEFPATPPLPGAAAVLSFPAPERFSLPNGLDVVVVRRSRLPLVTAELIIKSGSAAAPEGLAGLPDITARMLSHGAGGMKAADLVSAAEQLGSSLVTDVDEDRTLVSMTVLTPNLDKALTMIGRVVISPDFSEEEFSKVRGEATDAARMRLSNPGMLAAMVASRQVFGAGSYGQPVNGTLASLQRLDVNSLKRFHEDYYRPDNAALVFTGDISRADALRLASRVLGDWKKPRNALSFARTAVQPSRLGHVIVVDQPGAGQAGVAVAHLAPRRDDADYYQGIVANGVLGGSYSSRLNEEVRIRRGLSYGAFSRLFSGRDGGVWSAVIQTKNISASEVATLTLDEFSGLATRPPSEQELAARKATIVGAYGRSFETTQGVAARIASLVLYGLDLSEITRYVPAVQAVTVEQVSEYARKNLRSSNTYLTIVGDGKQFDFGLKKAGFTPRYLKASAMNLDSSDLN